MSRGPGSWQRALLNVTDGGLAMTVKAVVLDSVPQPARSDYVSARRATRSLAEAGRLSAVYLSGCRGCGAVQRVQRPGCCASSRPLLGIAPIGTRPPSLAPPPAHRPPSWITAAAPGPALAGAEVASVPGVLDVMIQRGLARVCSGEAKVGPADLLAALRLRAQIEAAHPPDTGQWQEFTVALLDATRTWLGPEQFRDLLAAVRSSPAFQAMATWPS
jgi:hypothetical protein